MQATSKIFARIKKLLALATSPVEHEAASARDEAERLMRRYGLRAADFEADVIEIIGDECDDNRLRLARAIGASRRVATLASKAGQMAFRGKQRAVSNAAELYRLHVDEVARNCNIGYNDPGRVVWRLCFWAGFVDAVCDRLLNKEMQSWFRVTLTHAQRKQTAHVQVGTQEFSQQFVPTPAIDEQRAAVKQFAGYFNPSDAHYAVERMVQDAYEAGRRFGSNVRITEYDRDEVAAADRMLAAEGEDWE